MATIKRNNASLIFTLMIQYVSAFSFKSHFRQPLSFGAINNHVPMAQSLKMSQVMDSTLPPGMIKQIKQVGNGPPIRIGDVATVKYTCDVVGNKDDLKNNGPFAKSPAQKFVVGDGLMIDGWEIALQSMRGGERSIVRLSDPKLGYGAAGVPPIIPSDAVVEMDLEILQVEAGVDLGTIASADPLKPRTPASIAAAYNTRRENALLNEVNQKEGLEGLIEKFRTFYFFGFFEGETGEQAPWYLRPSITFPIAFAVVGAAFWVAYAGGGITERGVQIKDELDEIVVSFNNGGALINQVVIMALCLTIGLGN